MSRLVKHSILFIVVLTVLINMLNVYYVGGVALIIFAIVGLGLKNPDKSNKIMDWLEGHYDFTLEFSLEFQNTHDNKFPKDELTREVKVNVEPIEAKLPWLPTDEERRNIEASLEALSDQELDVLNSGQKN